MSGIVTELLRLEDAKKQALITLNAPVYDELVQAQLCLLDTQSDLEASARKSLPELARLSAVVRLNTVLFRNLVSTSPLFALSQTSYTSRGSIETRVGGRLAVEG